MGDTKPAVVVEGEKPVEASAAAPVAGQEQEQQVKLENKATTAESPAPAAAPAAVVMTKALANGQEEAAQEVAPSSEPPTPSVEPAAAATATRKRKAGQEAPPAASGTGGAESKAQVGLSGGVKLEDLAPAVRARMEEVLQEGEDDEMRQDARLVNFLGEVEEAQVLRLCSARHQPPCSAWMHALALLVDFLCRWKSGFDRSGWRLHFRASLWPCSRAPLASAPLPPGYLLYVDVVLPWLPRRPNERNQQKTQHVLPSMMN